MKDNLQFALFTGEKNSKYGNNMAKHIAEQMRTLYGGSWSVFSRYYDYRVREQLIANKFDWKKGTHASFYYDNYIWYVYQNDCGSSDVISMGMAGNPLGSKYSFSFDPVTNMKGNIRDTLEFAISSYDFSQLDIDGKVRKIYERMRRVYGGGWSVHLYREYYSMKNHPYSYFSSLPGYYAKFTQRKMTFDSAEYVHEYFVSKQMC